MDCTGTLPWELRKEGAQMPLDYSYPTQQTGNLETRTQTLSLREKEREIIFSVWKLNPKPRQDKFCQSSIFFLPEAGK